MEKKTQRDGFAATPRWVLVLALVASIVVHVLPFPAHILKGLVGSWRGLGNGAAEPDGPALIPVELFEEEERRASQEGVTPDKEITEPTVTKPVGIADAGLPDAETQVSKPDAGDAGVDSPDEASSTATDAGVVDALADVVLDSAGEGAAENSDPRVASSSTPFGVDPKGTAVPALTPDAAPAAALPDAGIADAMADGGQDAGTFRPIASPNALAGAGAKMSPSPNISIIVYSDRIRQHSAAAHFAPMLTKIQQWKSFFGGTGLDPVQDTDRIYIAGPQFRNTAKVTAIVRYRVPDAKIRNALDVIVKRSGNKGSWAQDSVPVARAEIDKSERVFVMSGPNTLVVGPPELLDKAKKVQSPPPAAGNLALSLFMRTPRNGLAGLPVNVPDSLHDMLFEVRVAADRGVDLRLTAVDKDAATAAETAKKLTESVDAISWVSVLGLKVRRFDPITFVAVNERIQMQTHLTESQLISALSGISAMVDAAAGPKP